CSSNQAANRGSRASSSGTTQLNARFGPQIVQRDLPGRADVTDSDTGEAQRDFARPAKYTGTPETRKTRIAAHNPVTAVPQAARHTSTPAIDMATSPRRHPHSGSQNMTMANTRSDRGSQRRSVLHSRR